MIEEIEIGSATIRELPRTTAPRNASASSLYAIGLAIAGIALCLFAAFVFVVISAAVAWSIWNRTPAPKPVPVDPTPQVDPQEKTTALQKATDDYVNLRPKFQAELWREAGKLTRQDKFGDFGDLKEWIETNKKSVDNSAGKALRPFFEEINGVDFTKSDLDETFCDEFAKALENR